MVCLRFTNLLLGLLLSLATLGESFATTHQGIDALANTRHTFIPNKELQDDEADAAAAATKTTWKWLRGRKMGVEDAMVKEMVKGKMNTGIGVHSPNSFGSPSINDHKTQETKFKIQESSFGLVKSSADTQNLEESTNELNNMLSKDYGTSRRRRPPINNHQPLEDFTVDDP